jgi:pSer/pThr/pTyr-binding forkhead associated (FHA) protein
MVDHNPHDSLESVLTEGFIVGESEGSWCDVFPLYAASKVTVGREGHNDVVIPDGRCSRDHCVFRKIDGSWYVCDLGSSNGTFVNGNLIGQKQKLRPGDRIKIASQKLLYAATVVDSQEILDDFAASRADATI